MTMVPSRCLNSYRSELSAFWFCLMLSSYCLGMGMKLNWMLSVQQRSGSRGRCLARVWQEELTFDFKIVIWRFHRAKYQQQGRVRTSYIFRYNASWRMQVLCKNLISSNIDSINLGCVNCEAKNVELRMQNGYPVLPTAVSLLLPFQPNL